MITRHMLRIQASTRAPVEVQHLGDPAGLPGLGVPTGAEGGRAPTRPETTSTVGQEGVAAQGRRPRIPAAVGQDRIRTHT